MGVLVLRIYVKLPDLIYMFFEVKNVKVIKSNDVLRLVKNYFFMWLGKAEHIIRT